MDRVDLIAEPEARPAVVPLAPSQVPRLPARRRRASRSLPLGASCCSLADGTRARLAAAIYRRGPAHRVLDVGRYHLVATTPTARRRMQLADHSMIYLLIAGTWAPICLLVLPPTRRQPLPLRGVRVAAAVGIGLKLFGIHRFPRSSNSIYAADGLGRCCSPCPAIIANIEPPALVLLAAGGLAYSVGAAGAA